MPTTATTSKVNNPQPPHPMDHVWVYGKSNPGWYIASWVWSQKYADKLRTLGFEVRQSVSQPTE